MKTSEQGIMNLAAALSKFQEEVRNPSNSATNPQFRSKYAPLDVVINTVKPVLAKNGLSFLQSTGSEGESISVTTLLIHESGEWIQSDPLTLPAYQIKGGGAKEYNAQGAGSSLTYARRYSLSAMLGLSSEDDDDANGQVFGGGDAKSNKTPTAKGTSATTAEPSARDKAIAAANAKKEADAKAAEAKAVQGNVQGKVETPVTTPTVVQNDDLPFSLTEPDVAAGVEPVNKAQLGAIGNMLRLVAKKKGEGFDLDAFTLSLVQAKGKNSLEELTFEQGKEIVMELNTKMRE